MISSLLSSSLSCSLGSVPIIGRLTIAYHAHLVEHHWLSSSSNFLFFGSFSICLYVYLAPHPRCMMRCHITGAFSPPRREAGMVTAMPVR